jgi:hypothetical protein
MTDCDICGEPAKWLDDDGAWCVLHEPIPPWTEREFKHHMKRDGWLRDWNQGVMWHKETGKVFYPHTYRDGMTNWQRWALRRETPPINVLE